jgi:hypothetical protein
MMWRAVRCPSQESFGGVFPEELGVADVAADHGAAPVPCLVHDGALALPSPCRRRGEAGP